MKTLPLKFQWLDKIPVDTLPKLWIENRKHYGVLETPGTANTPEIMSWAKEFGASGYYKLDSIPWCGLYACVPMGRAGYRNLIPRDPLAAKSWNGVGVSVPKGMEMFMDVLVFSRPGGNHVGYYIAENKTHFLVYGGNTADSVGFAWIEKTRLQYAGRIAYNNQPKAIKKYFLEIGSDKVSTNEV